MRLVTTKPLRRPEYADRNGQHQPPKHGCALNSILAIPNGFSHRTSLGAQAQRSLEQIFNIAQNLIWQVQVFALRIGKSFAI